MRSRRRRRGPFRARRSGARRLRLRRPGPRLSAATIAVLLVLGGAFLWLRDSSLVAVQRVRVAGVSGPDAAQIRSALRAAARNMTTLDVNMSQLHTAVAPYPVVKSLEVSTQFPHGMEIRVIEQVPVAILAAGAQRIPVSADGTLLHDVPPLISLPTIALRIPPGGASVTGYARQEVALLAAAPYPLLGKIAQVTDSATHGLVAELRSGPSIYFGDSSALSAKWAAATAVLASSSSSGAPYIDVTVPNRPAAGGGSDTNVVAGSSPTTTSSGSPAAGATATSSGPTGG